jgi:hypothetical protein
MNLKENKLLLHLKFHVKLSDTAEDSPLCRSGELNYKSMIKFRMI